MPSEPSRRQQIVSAAIELLDDEGLDGLSMRRLGERTGASATSVYWYVQSKEALVALTLDTVIAEVALPDVEALGWRRAASAMARDFRAMILRHPWLALVSATYPTAFGPRLARHNEHVLAVYQTAGFHGDALEGAEAAVYSFVLGAALGEVGARAWRSGARADAGATMSAETLAEMRASVQDRPRLAARLDALEGSDATAMSEASFEFGLEALLDGLAARLAPPPRA